MTSIEALLKSYQDRTLSPVEVVKQTFDRIEAKKDLNAYLVTCKDEALTQAKIAEEAYARGEAPALAGVPLGVKDLFTLEGMPTTCASKILEGYRPPYTATCVQRLREAGAIVMGKLNMDEFAMGSSNENSAYGDCLHPTHPDRVPGGSSGGSATAVAADLCAASLGTDTGGSIRLPASFCGVVGVKPTYGRVSRYGMVAFASSLDQAGPLTHTVRDAARVLSVMSGHDPRDSTSAPLLTGDWMEGLDKPMDLSSLNIGVPQEFFGEGLDADVEKAIQESIKWYEAQGAKIHSVSLPHARYATAVYYVVAVCEASSNLSRYDGVHFGVRPRAADGVQEFYEEIRSLFGEEVKRRIMLGTFALSSGFYEAYYTRACQVRRLIQQDFERAFESVDLILGPVAPCTAFKRGERQADPLKMYLTDVYTIPASLAGLPAMSLPCGKDGEGLSMGLQLIAPAFREDVMLGAAHSFEEAHREL